MQNQSVNLTNQILLYADDGYLSHQVRLVLLEKQIVFDEVSLDDEERFLDRFEDLADLNPYNTLPVLVYRDLILYQNMVIFEYLEDRYYQNKLLPDNPADRANYRQLIWRINQDWIAKSHLLLTHADSFDKQHLDKNQADSIRKDLQDSLITLSPLFAHKPFFMSDKFGLCDCILASVLCRLDKMQIALPAHLCRPILHYQQRLFSRDSFKKSLIKK